MARISGVIKTDRKNKGIGPDVGGYKFALKADPGNAGIVYVGDDGDGAATFPLSAGEGLVVEAMDSARLIRLNTFHVEATSPDDVLHWLKVK